jgi:hypothetical protein
MAVSPRRYTQQEIDDLIGCPKKASSEGPRAGLPALQYHRGYGSPACATRIL